MGSSPGTLSSFYDATVRSGVRKGDTGSKKNGSKVAEVAMNFCISSNDLI